MPDVNDPAIQAVIAQQVAAQLAARSGSTPAAPPQPAAQPVAGWGAPAPMVPAGAMAGWGAPAPAAPPTPIGVLVPVEIDTPKGKATTHLMFGPEHAGPGALAALVHGLLNMGVPVKAWAPKEGGYGGGYRNGNGYGNRGGWGR